MIVEINEDGKFKEVGTVRLINNKVVFNISDEGVEELLKTSCYLSPKNGKQYMDALEAQFERSTEIILTKEKGE
jgi:tRNA A37 threonylcarbamoyladenosine synthetase subunit TsaC/SUA5/YrdC